jgi:predicted MFS family arabinose efflux permease
MISYFTAGAIGSYIGTMAWEHLGWAGVCGLGGMLLVLGLVIQFSTRKVPCES